jgi:uncharacterized protein (TIGR02444 family)
LRLWAFASAAWERPGVSEACLHLQDGHGQCVPLLLWRAWAEREGRPVPAGALAEAVAVTRVRERDVIAPLRAARQAAQAQKLSGNPSRLEAAQKAEIEAEQALLSALENLTSSALKHADRDLTAALETLVRTWNGCRARSAVQALAERLA